MMHNKQIKNRFVLFLQKFMLAALKALILSKAAVNLTLQMLRNFFWLV